MDPYVINMPQILRWILVNVLIVPTRAKASTAAYRSIWPDASEPAPLIRHSQALAKALEDTLNDSESFSVALAFRYGKPDIRRALKQFESESVEEILVLPQYPHHADSTRTTSIEKVKTELEKSNLTVPLRILEPFYREPAYIAALADVCREHMEEQTDHLLFSFHGLPEQHILDADPQQNHCLKNDCCETPSLAHNTCYRHQVYTTAKLVAQSLNIQNFSVSFQSRLGRQQWLRPYTDQVLHELPKTCKNIAVICPAFTADNLETLEEMDMRGRETFLRAGGVNFTLIPCLNQNPLYVQYLANWCKQS